MKIVGKTNFDLTTLFRGVEAYTGQGCQVSGESNCNTLIKSFKNNENILKAIHYTFMTVITEEIVVDIYECLDLKVIRLEGKLSLISGSLFDWKSSIVRGCNLNGYLELNNLLSIAYNKFKNEENLGWLWLDYKTTTKNNQLRFIE